MCYKNSRHVAIIKAIIANISHYELKGRKGKRNRWKSSQWLSALFLNSLRKMPRGTQVKRDGLVITVERKGTSSRIALRYLSCP